ncbi:RadC family protein [Candidatus Protochlamydia phocaeensis]|uniref:RadC family protein n=1 Tax=Candidatus Protochlamydia phocaeensis TaxID=1414722 RepID=UPI0008391738|nr:DNA repair protein RadC [Candidatus Protochlamydia phocaeensis]
MDYSIQRLPEEDRPRERLLRFGAESLSVVELIALILGSGTKTTPVLQLAQHLIARFGSLQKLAEATMAELLEVKGIGQAKAIQLKAALNLGMRASRQLIKPRCKIEHPIHAYQLIKEEMEKETREIFVVILQDTKGYIICHEIVSIGSLSQALVHPREVFYPCIRHKAASLIVAHNHPSGDPTPSPQDFELTRVLVEASHLLSIPLHDHLIIGKDSFISLRQKGFNFN